MNRLLLFLFLMTVQILSSQTIMPFESSQQNISKTTIPSTETTKRGVLPAKRLEDLNLWVSESDKTKIISSASSILKEDELLTDPFGLQAQGPLIAAQQPNKKDNSPVPAPVLDYFKLAFSKLSVSLAFPNEQWVLIGTREMFLGDTLTLSYAGQIIRGRLSKISSKETIFESEKGDTVSLPVGGRELSFDSDSPSLELIPGLRKERPKKQLIIVP